MKACEPKLESPSRLHFLKFSSNSVFLRNHALMFEEYSRSKLESAGKLIPLWVSCSVVLEQSVSGITERCLELF